MPPGDRAAEQSNNPIAVGTIEDGARPNSGQREEQTGKPLSINSFNSDTRVYLVEGVGNGVSSRRGSHGPLPGCAAGIQYCASPAPSMPT